MLMLISLDQSFRLLNDVRRLVRPKNKRNIYLYPLHVTFGDTKTTRPETKLRQKSQSVPIIASSSQLKVQLCLPLMLELLLAPTKALVSLLVP
jgi:hypothetical protein